MLIRASNSASTDNEGVLFVAMDNSRVLLHRGSDTTCAAWLYRTADILLSVMRVKNDYDTIDKVSILLR